jgi:hypothetical protein
VTALRQYIEAERRRGQWHEASMLAGARVALGLAVARRTTVRSKLGIHDVVTVAELERLVAEMDPADTQGGKRDGR